MVPTHQLTNGLIIKENLPEGIVTGLDDNLTSIIDDLVLIQRKTGQTIQFPEIMRTIDLYQMKDLVRVLTTGSIHMKVPTYSFSADREFAIKFASAYEKSEILAWFKNIRN